jgi:molecular chaperone GrpE (heat shock protein)
VGECGSLIALLTRDMPEPEQLLDDDFDAQLRGLFAQAEKSLEESAVESREAPAAKEDAAAAAAPGQGTAGGAKATPLSLPQLIRPLVLGLEAVSRVANENSAILKRLEQGKQHSQPKVEGDADGELPQLVADLRLLLDAKSGLSQSMFAALHEELKGYKDGFLLETIHKPIIRDLISLYDDVSEIHRQLSTVVGDLAGQGAASLESPVRDRFETIATNLEHNVLFIVEVLDRLEVTLMPPHTGKLHKRWQRAVAVEDAESPEGDGDVVRCVKRGFFWRGRAFRPEEVVVKRWKDAPIPNHSSIENLEEERA